MWTFEKTSYSEADILLNESLYALGNGYLGVRGCLEEQLAPSIRGTYINGFYDISVLSYSEKLYGFPDVSERMLNVIETQTMLIYLDGEQVVLNEDKVTDYKHTLDLKKGYVIRRYDYLTNDGKVAKICFRRLVSLIQTSRFIIDLSIEFEGDIRVESHLDGDVTTFADDKDPRLGSHRERLLDVQLKGIHDDVLSLEAVTKTSKLKLSVHTFHLTSGHQKHETLERGYITILEGHGKLNVTKYNDYNNLSDAYASFDEMLLEQENYLEKFWASSDIKISGDDKLQLSMRFNLFQLLQSCGRDGKSNIAAKGLTGEGYEGHTFWDTEIYMLPGFLFNQSDISRTLLINRYSQLEESRQRARTLGYDRGVKFPWRTITGRECSSFFPAGTAQYHINADIAYSVMQYYFATEDKAFMKDYGHELILDTALTWLEIGHFYKGEFRIDAVTGPDEYSCVVNNNYYTNRLAQFNMHWAYKLKDEIDQDLMDKLHMNEEDFDNFKLASEKMFLPYDENMDIHLQDEHFLSKKKWDFENTPEEKYPLLLHYHPLTIYRYQVLKQADTVLAHLLLPEGISKTTLSKSYDYYKAITTHDSSLSACVYGMMASKLGRSKEALDFFYETVYLDFEDMHGNTKDGLHMANLAGSVLSIYKGFLGIEIHQNDVRISPNVPEAFGTVEVKIKIKGRTIELKVSNKIELKLLEGSGMAVRVYDKMYELKDELILEVGYD